MLSYQPPPPTLRDPCILPTHPPHPSTIRDLWCLSRTPPPPPTTYHQRLMVSFPALPPTIREPSYLCRPPPSPTLGDPWCLSRPPPTYHQRPMVSFRIPPPTIRDPWRLPLTPPERWVPSLYDSFDHFPRLLAALIELISIDVFWHIFRSNLFRPRWRKRANPVQP